MMLKLKNIAVHINQHLCGRNGQTLKIASIIISLLLLISCNEPKKDKQLNDNNGWKKVGQIEKTIKNVNFTFPDSGFAFENKEKLMHLISMLEWDYPPSSSTWMNEGLGTFAENSCSGWSVAEIYRYFLETDQLIPMDLLSSDFYKQPEMFAYHQSGYIVEYLLVNYSIEQFKQLWKNGFGKFQEIYGIRYEKVKDNLEAELKEKYPSAPKIDPETFKKPCE